MPIYLGSNKLSLSKGVTAIKEAYLGTVKVLSAGLEFIKNSVSSLRSLTNAYASNQGTYTIADGYNGFTFKSGSSNNGIKVVYYPLDIRAYRTAYIKASHYSTGTTTMRSGADVFVGTESQIKSVRYNNWASDYGCTTIVEDNHGSGGGTTTDLEATVDISARTSGATEPIYIGIRLNSYFGTTNRILIETLTLS